MRTWADRRLSRLVLSELWRAAKIDARKLTRRQSQNAALVMFFSGIAVFACVGCGAAPVEETFAEYDDLHPVSGQIRYRGEPIPDATVRLHPTTRMADGKLVHPPSGLVREDGTFEIRTFRPEGPGRGAPAGNYRVSISWRGRLKGLSETEIDELKERLPAKVTRATTSDLSVTVNEGENAIPPIRLE